MIKTYDAAIIGAGTAGLTARAEVAKHTNNYVVIDGGTLGTTCARVGCMPSKSLISIAKAYHSRQGLESLNLENPKHPCRIMQRSCAMSAISGTGSLQAWKEVCSRGATT